MPVSPQALKEYPYLGKTWQARLVFVPEPTGEIKGFITSMICPTQYSLKRVLVTVGNRTKLWQVFAFLGFRQNNLIKSYHLNSNIVRFRASGR